jgi:hypothetical protein
MKHLIIFFLAISASTSAQNSREYVYDNAGNRTQRIVLVLAKNMQTNNAIEEQNVSEEQLLDGNFTLYPNPTSALLSIEADASFMLLESKKLYVYDLTGKLLLEKEFSESTERLDFSTFTNGSYIVQVIADGKKKEWRVMKN